MTHICVSKPTTIGSDNGLSPGRRQAIIWANAGILLIGPLGTNLSEILREIQTFSLKKIYLKMSSGKWRPFCLGLNVFKGVIITLIYTTSKLTYNLRFEWLLLSCIENKADVKFIAIFWILITLERNTLNYVNKSLVLSETNNYQA